MDEATYRFVVLPIALGAVLGAYANLRQYRKTREWLGTHNIDISFYEQQILEERINRPLRGFINYYIGWPGRHLAYVFHPC